jgi:hypothetical protein
VLWGSDVYGRTVEAQCNACFTKSMQTVVCRSETDAFYMSEVIKIDPPALPESIERKKELTG